jgi:hypothetical protein
VKQRDAVAAATPVAPPIIIMMMPRDVLYASGAGNTHADIQFA